ncbi:hypothetical protein K458DRAFT_431141 [Lentithecium fluviatile CBS 122367]|uniref:Tat pathway signal sequence n=1 Tax=Lentithecium fluviatile CBS 122367 TaxID=1168545 RepID=A0A6G1J2W5_9PLEO|nr:hypothetical protein K458DRAFT_431141 [Lentithecium fluviatile CBS 122367]
MAREYVYDSLHQTDEQDIGKCEVGFESKSVFLYRYLPNPSVHLGQCLLVVVLVAASFLAGSLIHPVAFLSDSHSIFPPHDHGVQDAGSTRDFVPQFSHELKSFSQNESFHGYPSAEVTKAWVSLIPSRNASHPAPGGWETYLMPEGQGAIQLPAITNVYNNTIYNIAVYHGLHCLYTLRQSFFAFHQMVTSTSPIDRPAYQSAYMLKHGSHCIDYIRQQLMCNPDLTLEPIDLETGAPKDWGVERECVDWEQVAEWAVRERSNDETGIV